jgi:hypothetical protein
MKGFMRTIKSKRRTYAQLVQLKYEQAFVIKKKRRSKNKQARKARRLNRVS